MVSSEVIEVPVIIVGGGGCGLSMSAFLSDYGVQHLLFERKDGASALPKAHYLNQRTMETFRVHELHREIQQKSCPPRLMSQIAWATTLGGSGPLDRKMIHKYPCFGGDGLTPREQAYRRDAPERSANLPLCRMEPILRRQAEERNPGNVLFNHAVLDFHDAGDHVEVTVQGPKPDEKVTTYHTRYLIGADGGRLVGPKIGITMEGRTGITDMVSVHFGADLSQYWEDDRFFACHLINGSCGTVFESGAIVPMGPTWGRHSEEWVCHFGFALDDEARFQEDRLVPRIRELLKIPDLPIQVHRISHWIIEKVVADKYKVGNVMIAGDAAHRRPPTTGLGLNTAIEDALNLAWKLALVLNHQVDPQILDTYETERRPIGRRNADWGLFTFENSSVINASIGLVTGQAAANQTRFEALFQDSLTGHSLLAQVQKMIESQCIEFSAHAIELGFTYEDGVRRLDAGDVDVPAIDPLGQDYIPTTRPGHRLPHAWIEWYDGTVKSTHDLVGRRGSFVVVTDAAGLEWVAAAKRATLNYGIPVVPVQIGPSPLALDRDDQWAQVKGVRTGGAVLVRPDNIVAWRSKGPSQAGGRELEEAFAAMLGLDQTVLARGDGINGANGVNGVHGFHGVNGTH